MTRRGGLTSLVSLADRLAALQLGRLALAIGVVAVTTGAADVWAVTAAYAVATSAVEWARRASRARGLLLVRLVVLVDGCFLAFVVDAHGGHAAPAVGLLYVHVVAITLLVSYRAGLVAAAWHAVLLYASQVGAGAGVVGSSASVRPDDGAVVAGTLVALAIVAAGGSAMSERTLHHRRGELQALVELGGDLERAKTAHDVVVATSTCLRAHLGFRSAAVAVEHAGVTAGVLALAGGVRTEQLDPGPHAWPEAIGLHRVVRGTPIDALIDGCHNVVVVPLVVDGSTVGAVAAAWGGGSRARLRRSTLDTVRQVAAQAGLALAKAWLVEEITLLAARDPLTGLCNRRAYEESFEVEVRRARRTGEPLSVVLLDVDHFKAVNDTHGHEVGDLVLRQVGAALAGTCREIDVAARYGGEEFVVLLPGCSDDAFAVAERLRRAVGEGVTAVPVTASAGVATFPDHAAHPDRLVALADEALYRAKASGRDRTELAPGRRRERLLAVTNPTRG